MTNFPQFERFLWLDDQLRDNRFPNASKLADHFELSVKTAQRNIAHFRDRLLAPVEYDPEKKGYYYADNTFELPYLQATQEEILAILLARHLLTYSVEGFISQQIARLGARLFAATRRMGITETAITEGFSATWTGYSPAASDTFRHVSWALLNRRLLSISYRSPAGGQSTTRTVEPHHLQHYMASWVLIAFCRLRNQWRKFYLARMESVTLEPDAFEACPADQWRHLLEGSWGIFQGDPSVPVTLKFNAFRARWIQEQMWHPDQQMKPTEDGGILLTLPVSDFREIKMKILQFGADVEVLEPEELRREILEEIWRMKGIYG